MIEWLIGLWEGFLNHLTTEPGENVTGYAEPGG